MDGGLHGTASPYTGYVLGLWPAAPIPPIARFLDVGSNNPIVCLEALLPPSPHVLETIFPVLGMLP